jgi:hypothetical protein
VSDARPPKLIHQDGNGMQDVYSPRPQTDADDGRCASTRIRVPLMTNSWAPCRSRLDGSSRAREKPGALRHVMSVAAASP